jgi:hypothetical protein
MSSSSDSSAGDNLQSIGECAGIDLINQPAEARNWVMEVLKAHMKKDQSVTVGNYCYLDGDKHVKVSIAMDVISAAVASEYVPQPATPASLQREISPVLKVQGPRHYCLPLHPYRCPRHQQRSAGSAEEKRRRLALVRPLLRQFASHLFSKAVFAGIKSCSVPLRALNSSPTLRRL